MSNQLHYQMIYGITNFRKFIHRFCSLTLQCSPGKYVSIGDLLTHFRWNTSMVICIRNKITYFQQLPTYTSSPIPPINPLCINVDTFRHTTQKTSRSRHWTLLVVRIFRNRMPFIWNETKRMSLTSCATSHILLWRLFTKLSHLTLHLHFHQRRTNQIRGTRATRIRFYAIYHQLDWTWNGKSEINHCL